MLFRSTLRVPAVRSRSEQTTFPAAGWRERIRPLLSISAAAARRSKTFLVMREARGRWVGGKSGEEQGRQGYSIWWHLTAGRLQWISPLPLAQASGLELAWGFRAPTNWASAPLKPPGPFPANRLATSSLHNGGRLPFVIIRDIPRNHLPFNLSRTAHVSSCRGKSQP